VKKVHLLMSRVLLLQPGIRQYRTALFNQLRERLAERGHELTLAHPGLGSRAALEEDEARLGWATEVRGFRLPGTGDGVLWMPLVGEAERSDLVIVPEFAGWLHTYQLLANRRRSYRLACWGHGPGPDDHARNRLTRAVRRGLAPAFDWWFSYTPGTTRRLQSVGVDANRITTLGNTLDVEAIRSDLRRYEEQIDGIRREMGVSGPVALFLGALRAEKNLDLVLDIGSRVAAKVPNLTLLVGGSGPDREFIEKAAEEHSWLRYLGPVFGESKARALAVADVMMQPTRVGLVVLDAFAAGLPLITFDMANHSPEGEYLGDAVQGIRVPGREPAAFAEEVVKLLRDDELRGRLRDGAWTAGSDHSLDGMVDRFVGGIEAALVMR
jgi:L-malate glycosyltransferase